MKRDEANHPTGNRKSFLFQLKKLRLQKLEPQKRKNSVYRDSLITDYFKTKKIREEPAIEISHFKSFIFDGIDENSLTVG